MLMMKTTLSRGLTHMDKVMEIMMRPCKILPLLFQESQAIFTSLLRVTTTEWSLKIAKDLSEHHFCWFNSSMVTTNFRIMLFLQTSLIIHSWLRKAATEQEILSPSKFNTSGTRTQSETTLSEFTQAKIWKSKIPEDKQTRSIWMAPPLLDTLSPHSPVFQDMIMQDKLKFLIPSLPRQTSQLLP